MHTVELLEQALSVAEKLGYQVRQEWLDGSGGVCEFGGRKWLFVDLSLTAVEQLDQVVEALRDDPRIHTASIPVWLRRKTGVRKAA